MNAADPHRIAEKWAPARAKLLSDAAGELPQTKAGDGGRGAGAAAKRYPHRSAAPLGHSSRDIAGDHQAIMDAAGP